MSRVYLVIRDEGEYSGREWSVEGAFSSMDLALSRACELAAAEYMNMTQTWSAYYPSFSIQEWAVDGRMLADHFEDVKDEARRRHPELEQRIKFQDRKVAERDAWLADAKAAAAKRRLGMVIAEQRRTGAITDEQYRKAAADLDDKYQ